MQQIICTARVIICDRSSRYENIPFVQTDAVKFIPRDLLALKGILAHQETPDEWYVAHISQNRERLKITQSHLSKSRVKVT